MVVSRVSGAEGMVASMSTKTKQRVQVKYVVKMHLTNRQNSCPEGSRSTTVVTRRGHYHSRVFKGFQGF